MVNPTFRWLHVVEAFAVVLGLGVASSACIDEHPYVPTFTDYVINLVNNHSDDPNPASYESFKDLPDPDGDANNTAAYDSLFQAGGSK